MSDETFKRHLQLEVEWEAVIHKFALRDWRFPPQRRQRNDKDQGGDGEDREDIEKPPYLDDDLIAMALIGSPKIWCTAREILHFIAENFPYYRKGEARERIENSIRSILSKGSKFVKTNVVQVDYNEDFRIGEDGASHRQRHYYAFRPRLEFTHNPKSTTDC